MAFRPVAFNFYIRLFEQQKQLPTMSYISKLKMPMGSQSLVCGKKLVLIEKYFKDVLHILHLLQGSSWLKHIVVYTGLMVVVLSIMRHCTG
jgi:hypothetical protein